MPGTGLAGVRMGIDFRKQSAAVLFKHSAALRIISKCATYRGLPELPLGGQFVEITSTRSTRKS